VIFVAHLSSLVLSDSDPDEDGRQLPQNIPTRTDTDNHNMDKPEDPTGHPEDADMSGPPSSPSNTEPSPDPKSRRLNIASLCNPMIEVPKIRQPQSSSLFDKNLDDVQRPASLKNYRCEQLFLFITVIKF